MPDQQPQLAYCPNCGDPEHRKPTATCDLEAMTPGAAAYVDAMRKVGTDQDVADAEAAARRQSPFQECPACKRRMIRAASGRLMCPSDIEGGHTVTELRAENERLREALRDARRQHPSMWEVLTAILNEGER